VYDSTSIIEVNFNLEGDLFTYLMTKIQQMI